jgi:uncharacterized protein (UPF0332 family)
MVDEIVKRLEREGKIAKQAAGVIQIEALLRESTIDLNEAKKTIHLSDRATYMLAYNAMLKAGRALLLMKGYRPVDKAQHKTVVEMTGALLGRSYIDLVGHFETMRRKRNEMTYEAGALLSPSESEQAFLDSITLVKKILAEVKARNPQIELEF